MTFVRLGMLYHAKSIKSHDEDFMIKTFVFNSFCFYELSKINKSNSLLVVSSIVKFTKFAQWPICFICSLMAEGDVLGSIYVRKNTSPATPGTDKHSRFQPLFT